MRVHVAPVQGGGLAASVTGVTGQITLSKPLDSWSTSRAVCFANATWDLTVWIQYNIHPRSSKGSVSYPAATVLIRVHSSVVCVVTMNFLSPFTLPLQYFYRDESSQYLEWTHLNNLSLNMLRFLEHGMYPLSTNGCVEVCFVKFQHS